MSASMEKGLKVTRKLDGGTRVRRKAGEWRKLEVMEVYCTQISRVPTLDS